VITGCLALGFFITLLTSVLFSGAERSVGSMSRDSLEKMAENNVYGARMILGMTDNKRRFHFMFLTGRLCSVAGGTVLLTFLISRSLGAWSMNRPGGAVIAFLFAVLAFVTTDEVLARLVSPSDHEAAVSRFALFLGVFHFLLFPLTVLFAAIASVLITRNFELAAKEEALMELVKSGSESGVIEEEEGEMIQSILTFSDTSCREVMVPRIDIIAADVNTSVDNLIALFKNKGHSRIPIYEERIDNIVGVIYAKDLLIAIAEKGNDSVSVTETMRKPYFVPETKSISQLLNDLREAKVHIAIVVDEYGGTSGIVALEDLIEEIIGEIQDEYDHEERGYSWIDSHTALMDGGLNIDEVNDILRSDIPSEDFDTLGGFLYHQLGFIPEGGEKIVWEDVTFTIKEIVGNRISKVLVKRTESRADTEQPEA
jgi:CBS domain containing-hemolysin-like protein